MLFFHLTFSSIQTLLNYFSTTLTARNDLSERNAMIVIFGMEGRLAGYGWAVLVL
jgi:hypothetical protein